ncbi:MAG TPA: HlyD family efflux transporter periplasmic adaptor subunit [Desulfosporosinus sp.]|nr:HlyD family efflux transporter periplasmic adaptor subunit [Desulfosporosinus sp.]
MNKKWMNKKWVTIGVVSALVLGGGYWTYKHFAAKPAVATNITAKAKMGNVSKVITATGTVSFPHAIPLTFQQSGKIVEINVKTGDVVKTGQVLAKIDDKQLGTAVLQAQANLMSAQASLQTLQDGFNAQTYAQAKATLVKAQQSLTTAQQNADPSYLANQVLLADQAVKQASDALAKAQQSGNTSSVQPAQNSLVQALNDQKTAENAQNGGAAQSLASAQADMAAAQYQVDQQAQGPKPGDLQMKQASIEIAKVQLASAQADLQNSSIIAPMDAVVVSVPLQLYQQSDAKSIITITPAGNNLQVDASIDQADIAQVKVGQRVDVTLDAYPDVHNSGTVSEVALQGTIVSNVTTFAVTVAVDKASELLRAGMNANINIVVAEAKNVLTVPSEAVKTRGTRTGVTVPATPSASAGKVDQTAPSSTQPKGAAYAGAGNATANVQYIPVEIGLDDGTNVEIKSGLKEGQEVIIGTRSSSTTASTSSGFRLGGGGNPARAMGGGRGN